MGSSAAWALAVAVFVAAAVEMVEAATIVVAMGITRGWRSAWAGAGVALVALAGFTAVTGYALVTWLPKTALQVVVGALLLVFGFQWLRKAILRSAGRKSMHDEAEVFERERAAARAAGTRRLAGLDYVGFVVSLKGVFLEGVEVVFIVITFGLNARDVPVAIWSALVAVVVVLVAALAVRGPLTRVPENTLKYAVALLLSTYGTFWMVEGLGVFRAGRHPLEWPGGDLAMLVLLAGWFALSRVLVRVLRVPGPAAPRAGELTGGGVAR